MQQIWEGVFGGGVVECRPVMKRKAKNDSEASAREFLVVGAEGKSAEELRAELEGLGYVVAVVRAGTAEEAAASAASEDDARKERNIKAVFRNLTASEIKVLSFLLENAGDLVSKKDIYRELYGGPGPLDSRAPDQLLRRLRDKLGSLAGNLESQRSVGVRWNADREVPSGFSARRIFSILSPFRAAVLSLLLVAGLAAGWLLRSGRDGEPGAGPVPAASELIVPPPPPPVRAGPLSPEMAVAPGHGPECMVDGDTNTWFQSAGPARKKDGVIVEYHPALRGTLSVQCGVPGSTNAPPAIRIGVITAGAPRGRRLGYVDPETGFFSCDIGEKPASRVVVVVAADSDEPFAVQSVRIDP